MSITRLQYVTADGVKIFYHSAGSPSSPVLLLLGGFPTSSHQFRDFIPMLAGSYHAIAPDYSGFGFTEVPASRSYEYTFANLATSMLAFLDALSIDKLSLYIFDYGAPVSLRMALQRPESITSIIVQNGNAYFEGFGIRSGPLFTTTGSQTPKPTAKSSATTYFLLPPRSPSIPSARSQTPSSLRRRITSTMPCFTDRASWS
jgi:pimeloyl-ACP methyl ester carboxylesterase